jgi:hypothetical protein
MTADPVTEQVTPDDDTDPGTPPADLDPATLEEHPEDRC